MDALLPLLQGSPAGPGAVPRSLRLFVRVGGTLVGTLVAGVVLLALAPRPTDETIDVLVNRPLRAFALGIGIFLLLGGLTVALALTVIGLVVAFPIFLGMVVFYMAGNAVVFLFVGEWVFDALDWNVPRWAHLLLGAAVATVLAAVPTVGLPLALVVSSGGVGAGAYYWWRGAVEETAPARGMRGLDRK